MNTGNWTLGLLLALLGAVSMAHADTMTSDGYSLEDYTLENAHNLADICAIDAAHPDHDIAKAFCYGFFEGAINYDDAIQGTPAYVEIVCSPEGTTRTDAVMEFSAFMKANPQYGSESPIDAVFRALSARWPCEES